MKKKYPSKVSYGLLLFIFLIFFSPVVFSRDYSKLDLSLVFALALMTVLYAVILYLFFQTKYIIHSNLLTIEIGVFTFKSIDIEDIKKISSTNSILSSPAPSFDRIEIEYGSFGRVIISPKDKLALSKELSRLNPKIENKLKGS